MVRSMLLWLALVAGFVYAEVYPAYTSGGIYILNNVIQVAERRYEKPDKVEAGNPIISTGGVGSWDEQNLQSPDVYKESNSVWRLYFLGQSTSGVYQTGYATSSDKGLTWTKNSTPCLTTGAVGAADATYAADAVVVHDGTQYRMYYTAGSYIAVATSTNGTVWTKPSIGVVSYGGNTSNNITLDVGAAGAWDSYQVGDQYVLMITNAWWMYYIGRASTTNPWYIGVVTSGDGYHWTRPVVTAVSFNGSTSNNIVIAHSSTATDWDGDSTFGVAAPSVSVDSSGLWRLLYNSRPKSSYVFRIGLATSGDGVTWTKYAGNPILREGMLYRWDSLGTAQPCLIGDEVYFMGQPISGKQQIGKAKYWWGK